MSAEDSKKEGMNETDGEGAWHCPTTAIATHFNELLAKLCHLD